MNQRYIYILLFLLMTIIIVRMNAPSQEEMILREGCQRVQEAIDSRDARDLASHLSDDATYVNFTTRETFTTHEEIAAQILAPDADTRVTLFIDTIQFKQPFLAFVKGVATVSPSNTQIVFTAECVEQNGIWKIKKIRTVNIEAPPSHYDKLKELEWLVGTWEDESDHVDIHSIYQWEKNRNFLVQQFTMKILDQKELTGEQVIGWDPIEQEIRSWIFDSDGGYGTCQWDRQGDSWYLRTHFILADGRKASATHVITKIDTSTYTFASEARDIDGKILPNIGPFRVVKRS